MRAEYEKSADLLVIELSPPEEGGYGDQLPNGPIVQYAEDGRALALEMTSVSKGFGERLEAGAGAVGEKFEVLMALAKLAIDHPDQAVRLDLEILDGHLTRV